MELHRRMIDCHESFMIFQAHPGYQHYGDLGMRSDWEDELSRLSKKHRSAVEELIRCLWKLRDVLPIFSPETMGHLKAYMATEVHSHWHPEEIEISALTPGDQERYGRLVLTVDYADMAGDFEAAISKLREFIAGNFAPEEMWLRR
jgi:hypothetical protein